MWPVVESFLNQNVFRWNFFSVEKRLATILERRFYYWWDLCKVNVVVILRLSLTDVRNLLLPFCRRQCTLSLFCSTTSTNRQNRQAPRGLCRSSFILHRVVLLSTSTSGGVVSRDWPVNRLRHCRRVGRGGWGESSDLCCWLAFRTSSCATLGLAVLEVEGYAKRPDQYLCRISVCE